MLGILCILAVSYIFSTSRRSIRWRTVAWGLGLQWTFAILALRWRIGQDILKGAGHTVVKVLDYSFAGSQFVFGELGMKHSPQGVIFALQVLPPIIFVSAVFSALYFLGVMQYVIRFAARLMQLTMRVSGAESMDVAASIFMDQTVAPLTIRPFLPNVTESELMTIMTAGMAHVAGGIMAAYIAYGISARHLLSAVIMTAPGTIMIAKMLVPETGHPATEGRVVMPTTEGGVEKPDSLLGAIANGTMDGGKLAFYVAIMLISFLSIIAMLNGMFGGVHNWLNPHHIPFPSSLNEIFGTFFAPVAWLIGVHWQYAKQIGNLLGTRMVINELVAYSILGKEMATLSPRAVTIATFALCGFANFSSIGIQIGAIGALAPNRRKDLARIGFKAMFAGTMANLLSAAIVSILL